MDDEMVIATRTVQDAEPSLEEPLLREVLRRRRLFDVDEYHQLAAAGVLDEDDRVELIAGEIVQMAPIGPAHAGKVNRLTEFFVQRFQGRAIVTVQNPVRLDRYSEPQPDVVLLRWRDDFYENKTPEPSDILLLVEVAHSSLAFDRNVKLRLYARAGIPEVWLLDVGKRQLTVHRSPGPDGYADERTVGPGESLAPAAFPEDGIDVDEILG